MFRYAAKHEALKLNLSGWMRNINDGRVETIFEGNEDNVQRMIEFCHQGPSSARVTNVKILHEDPLYTNKSFTILY
jgi:acylphosphatase